MSFRIRRWIFLALDVAAVLLVDQVTKRYVIAHLALGQSYRPIPALYPLFQFTRSENTGSAFGFLPQAGDIFLIIALIVVIIMLIAYPRVPDKPRLTRFAMGLVIGGALGNITDRITHGAVIDFIHYQIPGVISNVSNLADHAIVFGVMIIFVLNWRSESQKQAETASTEPDQS